MTEHIIGKFPDNAVVWDADSVTEREFNFITQIRESYGNANNQTAVIAVSFDQRTLNIIKDKNSKAIVIQRPVSISDFDSMFALYDIGKQKNFTHNYEKSEESAHQNNEQSPITVDSDTMTVQLVSDRKLKTIQLTAKEFTLFNILYLNKGQTVKRSEIIAHLNGNLQDITSESDSEGISELDSDRISESGNIIEVYIHYLRKKLGKKMIVSVRGEGYRLEL